MKNKKELEDLYDYCRWNDIEGVRDLFHQSSSTLDVLDDNGLFFRLAISSSNIVILNTLLEYYENTQLQGEREDLEYKVAKHKLQEVLKEAVNKFDIDKKIQKVLDKYIPKEEDSDLEQELGDIEDLMGFDFTKINPDQSVDHFDSNGHDLGVIGKVIDSH